MGFRIIAVSVLGLMAAAPAGAGEHDRAIRIFRRIAHVPPLAPEVTEMVGHLSNSSLPPEERDARAAEVALRSPAFYNTSLVSLFSTTTSAEQVPEPLNDSIALNVGIIRDNLPYKEILYGDHYYRGATSLNLIPAPTADPATYQWSPGNNDHYARMQALRIDLGKVGPDANLIRVSQTQAVFDATTPGPVNRQTVNGAGEVTQQHNLVLQSTTAGNVTQYPPDIAGVISTRAMAEAFFSAGTNRRMFRFVLKNYLCTDLEDIKDNTVSSQFVRRDVDRFPGGSHSTFQVNCLGCHGIQDAFGNAFAYFDFRDERMNYRRAERPTLAPSVRPKMVQNDSIFPDGFKPSDDTWHNTLFSSADPIKPLKLGWRTPEGGSEMIGSGAHTLGRALAATRAFSSCQVKKVFRHVCLREPQDSEHARLETITDRFENPNDWNYNFKNLFKAVVNVCL